MKKTVQKTLKIITPILITLLVVITFSKYANAQQPTRTFTLVPPTVEHELNPGEKAEGKVKIINDSNETLTFTATTQDFIVEDTNGVPTILPPDTLSNKYSAASWIAAYPGKFTVNPHEKFELDYYLQVPQDAKSGGHYAAVIYKPDELIEVEGTGAAVNTQVGTLFYVNVIGDIKENASITKFSANKFQEYGPVTIQTQIKNLGDLHIKPIGAITISDLLGRNIATLNLTEHNIFPEAIRDFENTLDKKILFGPFKAKLIATYGKDNNLPLVATMTFWVLPWKIMLIVILIIITAILGIMYLKKKSLRVKEEKLNKENPQE